MEATFTSLHYIVPATTLSYDEIPAQKRA